MMEKEAKSSYKRLGALTVKKLLFASSKQNLLKKNGI